MIIDFSEVKDHTKFELFVKEYLQTKGYYISNGPGLGPDGGKDMIATYIHPQGWQTRLLVSCKNHQNAVNLDSSDPSKLAQHHCQGFLYVYSSYPTSALREQIERSCDSARIPNTIITGADIEKDLIENPVMHGLIYQYFNHSHQRISNVLGIEECPRCREYRLGDISAYPYKQSDGSPGLALACGNCATYCLPDEILLGPSFVIHEDPLTL